jgi:hypothetical protein
MSIKTILILTIEKLLYIFLAIFYIYFQNMDGDGMTLASWGWAIRACLVVQLNR